MDMMSYLMGRNSGGGSGKGAKIEVVTELPETGESNVIYLVPKQDTSTDNIFDEYLWVNNDWELIGNTGIDLSDYIPMYVIEDNTYTNPFVIQNCKLGIYNFGKNSTIYYKSFTTMAISQAFTMYNGYWIITNSNVSSSSPDAKQKIGYVYGTRQNIRTGVFETFSGELVVVTALGSVDIENISALSAVPVTGNVTISGIKTFSTLPESSATPTTNNQLTNKKYVDDQIGSINTILATLTNPGGGGQ